MLSSSDACLCAVREYLKKFRNGKRSVLLQELVFFCCPWLAVPKGKSHPVNNVGDTCAGVSGIFLKDEVDSIFLTIIFLDIILKLFGIFSADACQSKDLCPVDDGDACPVWKDSKQMIDPFSFS